MPFLCSTANGRIANGTAAQPEIIEGYEASASHRAALFHFYPLSHEVRTPLSAILGWTQVLLRTETPRSADEQRRAIEVIDRNARALVQIIDDLLDLSRIMTGKIRLELRQVSFSSIVEAAVDSASHRRTRRDPPQSYSRISQDTRECRWRPVAQVVWNLLTNAIKFTPKGGKYRWCCSA